MLKPYDDPFESLESKRLYREYVAAQAWPPDVQSYFADPETWEHGAIKCVHDYYVASLDCRDNHPGIGRDAPVPRVRVAITLVCPKRGARLRFIYQSAFWIELKTSSLRWPGVLPQALADEVEKLDKVAADDGAGLVHTFHLDDRYYIRVCALSFKREVLTGADGITA